VETEGPFDVAIGTAMSPIEPPTLGAGNDVGNVVESELVRENLLGCGGVLFCRASLPEPRGGSAHAIVLEQVIAGGDMISPVDRLAHGGEFGPAEVEGAP